MTENTEKSPVYFYDDNKTSIEGSTDLAFTENRTARFEAYGWHVQQVEDADDLTALEEAIVNAQEEKNSPSLISVRTIIGYGSPGKQGTASAHGEALGSEELQLAKKNLGWPLEPAFYVPDAALQYFRKALSAGENLEDKWRSRFQAYEQEHPDLARQWKAWLNKELPSDWAGDLPSFPPDDKGMATRQASGKVLNAIAPRIPNLLGGSADLAPSTKTLLQEEKSFQADSYDGRNFHFGVREHGMGAILNGMALHGGLIPYGATFLIFSDYMRPPVRLAALMQLQVIFVFTHDSIGLGEDGPTHQPVEQLAALRAVPGLTLIRPCDANETAEAWRLAVESDKGPVALSLTRQGVPTLDRKNLGPARGLRRGAYVLCDLDVADNKPEVLLMGSGSEVYIACKQQQVSLLFYHYTPPVPV